MSDSASVLYISDEAWDMLVSQARMLGHVRADTARGMCDYVQFLMTCQMSDARPDDVRECDDDALAQHTSPEWRMHAPRVRRIVKLTENTLVRGAAHALRLGIAYHPNQRVMNAPSCFDLAACMSALLEAIGSDWVDVRIQDET